MREPTWGLPNFDHGLSQMYGMAWSWALPSATLVVMLPGMASIRGSAKPVELGLCANCIHAKRIESDRGSLFLLCARALTDQNFAKYPRLPVLQCSGYSYSPRSAFEFKKSE
jgi:hypothetical protein